MHWSGTVKSCCATAERPATLAIRGTVRYLGEPLKKRMMNTAGIPGLPPGGVPREDLVLDAEGGVAGALIYIATGAEQSSVPPPETPVTMEMDGFRYRPHVLALQVGQELIIHNRDSALHHPHPIGERNPSLSLFGFPKDEPRRVTFTRPEIPIKLKCDIHPWMSAYIAVLDHPYFAVTDEKGRFEMRDLPAGKYTLRLWHEKLQAMDQDIDVRRDVIVAFTGTQK
jgi:hypothetical protein